MPAHPLHRLPDPWAGPPARPGPTRPPWVPPLLLVAGAALPVASVAARAGGTAAVVVALAVLVLLGAAAQRWAPAVVARVAHGTWWAVTAVVRAAGAVVLVVVAALLLYLPGALAAVARARRSPGPGWVERGATAAVLRADAHRPFSSSPPRQRAARHATGVAALAATAVLALVLWPSAPPASGEAARVDVFERGRQVRLSELDAFAGVPFADELKVEQDRLADHHLVPGPVAGYDVADFRGRHTNVSGGERRTLEPPPCPGCPEATVWVVGGSAAFGMGQRDHGTIASQLVRLAAADATSLRVVNLGVPGYTVHQEAEKVLHRLERGPAPDLVVFYDGYNDVAGTVIGSTVNGIDESQPSLLRVDDIRRFTEEGLDPAEVASAAEMGRLAARRYAEVQRRVGEELRVRGVAVLHVLQPDALASPRQYAGVADRYDVGPALRRYLDEALEVSASELAGSVVDLRHVLDDQPPAFADLVHTNEDAAAHVAERLYPLVREQLGLPPGGGEP